MDGSKFCQQFLKRLTQGTLFQNQTRGSREEDFKELLKKFHFIAMATTVLESYSVDNFYRRPPKEHSC